VIDSELDKKFNLTERKENLDLIFVDEGARIDSKTA